MMLSGYRRSALPEDTSVTTPASQYIEDFQRLLPQAQQLVMEGLSMHTSSHNPSAHLQYILDTKKEISRVRQDLLKAAQKVERHMRQKLFDQNNNTSYSTSKRNPNADSTGMLIPVQDKEIQDSFMTLSWMKAIEEWDLSLQCVVFSIRDTFQHARMPKASIYELLEMKWTDELTSYFSGITPEDMTNHSDQQSPALFQLASKLKLAQRQSNRHKNMNLMQPPAAKRRRTESTKKEHHWQISLVYILARVTYDYFVRLNQPFTLEELTKQLKVLTGQFPNPRLKGSRYERAGLAFFLFDLLVAASPESGTSDSPYRLPSGLTLQVVMDSLCKEDYSILVLLHEQSDLPLYTVVARCMEMLFCREQLDGLEVVNTHCNKLLECCPENKFNYITSIQEKENSLHGQQHLSSHTETKTTNPRKRRSDAMLYENPEPEDDSLSFSIMQTAYPLLIHLQLLLREDCDHSIREAFRLVANIEKSSCLSFEEKETAYNLLFQFLLVSSYLFDKTASRPVEMSLSLSFVPNAGNLGMEVFLNNLRDISEDISGRTNLTTDEKKCAWHACQQLILELLINRNGDVRGVQLYSEQYGGNVPPYSPDMLTSWAEKFRNEEIDVPVSMQFQKPNGDIVPYVYDLLCRDDDESKPKRSRSSLLQPRLSFLAKDAEQESKQNQLVSLQPALHQGGSEQAQNPQILDSESEDEFHDARDDFSDAPDDKKDDKAVQEEIEIEDSDETDSVEHEHVEVDDDSENDDGSGPEAYSDSEEEDVEEGSDKADAAEIVEIHSSSEHDQSSDEEDADADASAESPERYPPGSPWSDKENQRDHEQGTGYSNIPQESSSQVEAGYEAEDSQGHATEEEEERPKEVIEINPAHSQAESTLGESQNATEEEHKHFESASLNLDPGYEAEESQGHYTDVDEEKPRKARRRVQVVEPGYEAGDSQGHSEEEEELSEAIHTEDEEDDRRRVELIVSENNGEGRTEEENRIEEAMSPVENHTLSDMSAADERTTGQEEDLAAESSEHEEAADAEYSHPHTHFPPQYYERNQAVGRQGSSLQDFAAAAQLEDDTRRAGFKSKVDARRRAADRDEIDMTTVPENARLETVEEEKNLETDVVDHVPDEVDTEKQLRRGASLSSNENVGSLEDTNIAVAGDSSLQAASIETSSLLTYEAVEVADAQETETYEKSDTPLNSSSQTAIPDGVEEGPADGDSRDTKMVAEGIPTSQESSIGVTSLLETNDSQELVEPSEAVSSKPLHSGNSADHGPGFSASIHGDDEGIQNERPIVAEVMQGEIGDDTDGDIGDTAMEDAEMLHDEESDQPTANDNEKAMDTSGDSRKNNENQPETIQESDGKASIGASDASRGRAEDENVVISNEDNVTNSNTMIAAKQDATEELMVENEIAQDVPTTTQTTTTESRLSGNKIEQAGGGAPANSAEKEPPRAEEVESDSGTGGASKAKRNEKVSSDLRDKEDASDGSNTTREKSKGENDPESQVNDVSRSESIDVPESASGSPKKSVGEDGEDSDKKLKESTFASSPLEKVSTSQGLKGVREPRQSLESRATAQTRSGKIITVGQKVASPGMSSVASSIYSQVEKEPRNKAGDSSGRLTDFSATKQGKNGEDPDTSEFEKEQPKEFESKFDSKFDSKKRHEKENPMGVEVSSSSRKDKHRNDQLEDETQKEGSEVPVSKGSNDKPNNEEFKDKEDKPTVQRRSTRRRSNTASTSGIVKESTSNETIGVPSTSNNLPLEPIAESKPVDIALDIEQPNGEANHSKDDEDSIEDQSRSSSASKRKRVSGEEKNATVKRPTRSTTKDSPATAVHEAEEEKSHEHNEIEENDSHQSSKKSSIRQSSRKKKQEAVVSSVPSSRRRLRSGSKGDEDDNSTIATHDDEESAASSNAAPATRRSARGKSEAVTKTPSAAGRGRPPLKSAEHSEDGSSVVSRSSRRQTRAAAKKPKDEVSGTDGSEHDDVDVDIESKKSKAEMASSKNDGKPPLPPKRRKNLRSDPYDEELGVKTAGAVAGTQKPRRKLRSGSIASSKGGEETEDDQSKTAPSTRRSTRRNSATSSTRSVPSTRRQLRSGSITEEKEGDDVKEELTKEKVGGNEGPSQPSVEDSAEKVELVKEAPNRRGRPLKKTKGEANSVASSRKKEEVQVSSVPSSRRRLRSGSKGEDDNSTIATHDDEESAASPKAAPATRRSTRGKKKAVTKTPTIAGRGKPPLKSGERSEDESSVASRSSLRLRRAATKESKGEISPAQPKKSVATKQMEVNESEDEASAVQSKKSSSSKRTATRRSTRTRKAP